MINNPSESLLEVALSFSSFAAGIQLDVSWLNVTFLALKAEDLMVSTKTSLQDFLLLSRWLIILIALLCSTFPAEETKMLLLFIIEGRTLCSVAVFQVMT